MRSDRAVVLFLLFGLMVTRAARAESVLVLPVPGASDTPRERLNLSIVIPAKVTPKPEEPQRERIKSSAMSVVDWKPFKEIPQKQFIFDTLKVFKRKGLVSYVFDKYTIDYGVEEWSTMGDVISRLYRKLLDVHRKEALKKFGLEVGDLERFQRVVDIYSPYLPTLDLHPVEMNKRIDEMIDILKKSTGRGQIRVTGVREGKDGTTLLELEVLRPPAYSR